MRAPSSLLATGCLAFPAIVKALTIGSASTAVSNAAPESTPDLCPPGANLFLNPSWEQNTDSWTYSWTGVGTSSHVASDGQNSLLVAQGIEGGTIWTFQQQVSFPDPEGQYKISSDFKLETTKGPVECAAMIKDADAPASSALIVSAVTLGSSSSGVYNWITVAGTFSPNGASQMKIRFQINCTPLGPAVTRNIYADNLSLKLYSSPNCRSTSTVSALPTTTPTSTPLSTPAATSEQTISSSITASPASTLSVCASPNLLVNPSFEQSADGWSNNWTEFPPWTGGLASDGKSSIIMGMGGNVNNPQVDQVVKLSDPNGQYKASFDYLIQPSQGTPPTCSAMIQIIETGGNYQTVATAEYAVYPIGDNTWHTLSGIFNANGKTQVDLAFMITCTSSVSDTNRRLMYADNASLQLASTAACSTATPISTPALSTPTSAPSSTFTLSTSTIASVSGISSTSVITPTSTPSTCVSLSNLLTNPSWESGQSGWTYNFSPSLSTDQSSSGSTSLQLLTTNQQSSWTIQTTVGPLDRTKKYRVSVDFLVEVYPLANTVQCSLFIFHCNAYNTLISTGLVTYTLADSWRTYNADFTPPNVNEELVVTVSCVAPQGLAVAQAARMYLDNVQFRQLIDCPTSTPSSTPVSSTPSSTPSVASIRIVSTTPSASTTPGSFTTPISSMTPSASTMSSASTTPQTTPLVSSTTSLSTTPLATPPSTFSTITTPIASTTPLPTTTSLSLVATTTSTAPPRSVRPCKRRLQASQAS